MSYKTEGQLRAMGQSESSICGLETKEGMTSGFDLKERTVTRRQVVPGEPAALEPIARVLKSKPFEPHPRFKSGHAQTFAAYYWPRRRLLKSAHFADEARIFEVEPGVRILAHCRWQKDRLNRPTIILVHGLEGSNASVYMLGTSEKAFNMGLNVVRLNLRNCGNTEHMTPTLYHAGLFSDLRAVVSELAERDKLSHIFLAGFSMGGNMTLLFAGQDARVTPPELAGVCAISPTIDLRSCVEAIELRSNRLYKQSFLRSMKNRIRRKRRLYPELYDVNDLRSIRTLRDFDERYTRVGGGFGSANEYYESASALQFIRQIRIPTLMIHAQDDPFVPFEPFRDSSIAENPNVIFLAPENGGHVGFVGAGASGEDRFWMEHRVVEFCKLVHERSISRSH